MTAESNLRRAQARWMREVNKQPYSQIALAMGCSIDAAQTLVSRARRDGLKPIDPTVHAIPEPRWKPPKEGLEPKACLGCGEMIYYTPGQRPYGYRKKQFCASGGRCSRLYAKRMNGEKCESYIEPAPESLMLPERIGRLELLGKDELQFVESDVLAQARAMGVRI